MNPTSIKKLLSKLKLFKSTQGVTKSAHEFQAKQKQGDLNELLATIPFLFGRTFFSYFFSNGTQK